MSDAVEEHKRTLSYSFPVTLGFFIRELLAVTFLLLVEQRVGTYDFFNSAFVLFIVLITFRTPYVNSYAFIFEILSLKSWSKTNHAGLQKHADFTQNLLLFIAVLGAHIGAAIGAAALRVVVDVTYGVESLGSGQSIEPILSVSVESLRSIDTFWGAEKRLDRLAEAGLFNGTRSVMLPINDIALLGLDSAALSLWSLLEEVGYVTLLCICYVHIWLGAGLGKNEAKPMEPFASEFWKRLFRMSMMLAVVNTALSRCFPTAHGSLHHTIYKCQYQVWNPDMRLVDNENQEPLIRVFGGILGVLVAISYNRMLIATRDNKDDEGYYYRFVWGREPIPDENSAPKTASVMYPERRYSRGVPVRYSKASADDGDSRRGGGYDVHAICVSRCRVHPNGTGCTAECLKTQFTQSDTAGAGANEFKLRIPHMLDHLK